MLTYVASGRQYAEHLFPIWKETGGRFLIKRQHLEFALGHGVTAEPFDHLPRLRGLVVCSARGDALKAGQQGRPVVFMAHGNGQSFSGEHRGYAGGPGLEHVVQFLAVNEYNAALWRHAYPGTPVDVIGCPKLDPWHGRQATPGGPVAISFHWDARSRGNKVCETWSAWPYYRAAVEQLVGKIDLLGHAHPRIAAPMRKWWDKLGVPYVADFADVLDQAGTYATDCSSTLYEFASIGPVAVLNIPEYRRDRHHGQRFWEKADVGPNCDRPEDLHAVLTAAQQDPYRERRHEIVKEMYPAIGTSAQRAAAVIQRSLKQGVQMPKFAADDILVANTSFTTTVNGRLVVVKKGQTRVAAGHPLTRGRAQFFDTLKLDMVGDIEAASAAPGERRDAAPVTKADGSGDTGSGEAAASGSTEASGDTGSGDTGSGEASDDSSGSAVSNPYEGMKQPQLKAELDKRNIKYPKGPIANAALIALLEADSAS